MEPFVLFCLATILCSFQKCSTSRLEESLERLSRPSLDHTILLQLEVKVVRFPECSTSLVLVLYS